MCHLPQKVSTKWIVCDLKKWLVLRCLPRSGKSAELKETIQDYLSNPETIPPICSRYTCPIHVVSNTLNTMNAFIQRVMQSTYNGKLIDETDNYVKLFLSFLHEWDSNIKDNESKPVWLSSYSLLNLLNLREMMLRFGPVRNLWEGGSRGEGILRMIKHHVSNVEKNWHICSTRKFYQHKSMERIMQQLSPLDSTKTRTFADKANNIHFYDKKKNLNDAFLSGQPISVFIDNNDDIFAMIDASIYAKFEIGEFEAYIMGLYYFNVNPPIYVSSVSINTSLKCFGLLLPRLSREKYYCTIYDDVSVTGVYTVITNNWTEIKQDRTFGYYQYSVDQSV